MRMSSSQTIGPLPQTEFGAYGRAQASGLYDARMTRGIHINPEGTPTERKLARAFREVDDIRSGKDVDRDELAAALDRRDVAQRAVDQEKAAKQG